MRWPGDSFGDLGQIMSTSFESKFAEWKSSVVASQNEIDEKSNQIPSFDGSNFPELCTKHMAQIQQAIQDESSSESHLVLAHSSIEVISKLFELVEFLHAKRKIYKEAVEFEKFLGEKSAEVNIKIAEFKTRRETKKAFATSGSDAKLKNDPKQLAKAEIFEEFKRWFFNETQFRTNSLFASEMCDRYPALQLRTRSIEAWLPKWRRELKGKDNTP